MRVDDRQSGFTLVEVVISIVVITSIGVTFAILFVALVNSTVLTRQRSAANNLALNQIEYLKSLPYDSLAVAGGNIVTSTPLPASTTRTIDGFKYTLTTSISYVDDAFDNCGPYPTPALLQKYCRNYKPSTPLPPQDTNPADYKIAHVDVTNSRGVHLAWMDTQISAKVSETASTTGALFVTVIDPTGTPVQGVTVQVTNPSVAGGVNVSDTSDPNGVAIFYGLPPDNARRYVVKASASGYSTLATIASIGSLQPTYPNQNVITQQASSLSLVVAKQRTHSLVLEAVDLTGAPLNGMRIAIKGGYKKYTLTSNQEYYYDTFNPLDSRAQTGADGMVAITDLAPVNSYQFCGLNGAQGCTIGGTQYYLVAALPYGGTTSLNPINVPALTSTTPTFNYSGNEYAQKVRLILSTNASLPRVFSISPDMINTSGSLSNVAFTIEGYNLSGANMTLTKDSTNYSHKYCNGNTSQLVCGFDLSGISDGDISISIQNASGTVTLPTTPQGGIHAKP